MQIMGSYSLLWGITFGIVFAGFKRAHHKPLSNYWRQPQQTYFKVFSVKNYGDIINPWPYKVLEVREEISFLFLKNYIILNASLV